MELAEFQRFLQFLTDRQPDEKPMPEEQVQLICAQFPLIRLARAWVGTVERSIIQNSIPLSYSGAMLSLPPASDNSV